MATPTASALVSPVTDANLLANHQAITAPAYMRFAPSHYNPVPVAQILHDATKATFYSETISAVGGSTPYTYAVTSGALPTGLSLVSASGVISGTPTVTGTYTFTITVTDSAGYTGSTAFQIIVSNPSNTGGSYVFIG